MTHVLADVDYTQILLQAGWFVGGVLACMITIWKKQFTNFFSPKLTSENDTDDAGHFDGFDLDKTVFTEQQSAIYSRLVKLQLLANAARVSIAMFHNGGELVLEGIPIKRYSVTHEVCEVGISHERQQRQSVLMTMYWEIVSYLRNNNPEILNVASMQHSNFKSSLESSGITHISILPITRPDGKKSVGFLLTEWSSGKMLNPPQDPMKVEQFEESYVRNRDLLTQELSQKNRKTQNDDDKSE